MPRQSNIIVGLDVGTTKVCALVGKVNDDRTIEIIGNGDAKSDGLSCGVVTNIDHTIEAINRAVDEASKMSNCKISDVYVSISGANIKGTRIDGQISLKTEEVRPADIENVLNEAREVQARKMPEYEVIHVLPQEYTLDGRDGIKNPNGLSAMRMSAKAYLIATAQTSLNNVARCCSSCRLKVQTPVAAALASSYAVLSKDEEDLGVVLVDIGGGTSDIAVWYNGYMVYASTLDYAGELITNDISKGMSTPTADAERLKREFGKALSKKADKNVTFEVPKVGCREPQQMSEQFLCDIIEPRVDEIISLIYEEIKKSGYEKKISAGVVLTGGSSLLPGIAEKFENITGLSTRIGYPNQVDGLFDTVNDPGHATAVGLLHFGAQDIYISPSKSPNRDGDEGLLQKIGSIFGDLFRF